MNFKGVAESIDSDIYLRFKEALELGKWPDDRTLTNDQKEICLQAVMLYEEKHKVHESLRTGYVDSTKKTSPCGPKTPDDESSPIRILH